MEMKNSTLEKLNQEELLVESLPQYVNGKDGKTQPSVKGERDGNDPQRPSPRFTATRHHVGPATQVVKIANGPVTFYNPNGGLRRAM